MEKQNIEETLWQYIDGSLDSGKTAFVEQLLQSDDEWRSKYAELIEVQQLLQNSMELEQPSLRFTQNVMEEISRLYIAPATRNYINKNVIRGIGLFFLTTILGLVVYVVGQVDWSQPGSGTMPGFQWDSMEWGRLFNSSYMNVFIMVNIVLALMLFDMYLTRKKNEAVHRNSE